MSKRMRQNEWEGKQRRLKKKTGKKNLKEKGKGKVTTNINSRGITKITTRKKNNKHKRKEKKTEVGGDLLSEKSARSTWEPTAGASTTLHRKFHKIYN